MFSGAFIESDSRRVDAATEDMHSLDRRLKYSTFWIWVSAPNLTLCLLLYFGSKLF
ncbi:DUF5316 family protein [Paenibacillus sp. GYB003]|uniref:DUF5316 family protein n=1 Tax=Paenibacillus sp. GYB003 TaxID=2994392 RepID=UPI003FA765AF